MSATIAQQKIRIRLKAFDRRMLDLSCEKIIETADHTAATAVGPIPLPTKRKIYCVLLARILVDVGRAQHAIDLALRGQGDGADGRGSGVVGGFDDFFAGQIQHAAIKRLQADADLLLSDGG